MWRARRDLPWTAAIFIAVLSGCFAAPKSLTYFGKSDLKYYKDLATKVDYPNHPAPDNPVALAAEKPRILRYPTKDELWNLSLAEAIRIALRNNKIIRTRDQPLLPRNPLVTNPDQIPSIYDPAVQETGILFGQRGVEAALSDFDATFTTSVTWGGNESIVNNAVNSSGIAPGGILTQDTAEFRARLDKTFADSSQLSFIQNWDYTANNAPANLFPSVYTGFVRAEFRRPLLAGSGTDYTRVAGPIGKNPSGVGQGVLISRINNDMAIADFESSVQTLIRDVQTSYWDLVLAYQTFDAQTEMLKSALKAWRLVHAKATQGYEGGSSADEAQALDNYFDSQGREKDALANIYMTEGQFRRLLGLPVNDGRIIRPCDDPTIAEFLPDWHMAVAEGIVRRPEIRKQKWNIKSLELQLSAAQSLVRPRLDFVAGGQINAFGDRLISEQSNPIAPGSSAFASLAEANQTGWNLGFEAAYVFGYRNAHSQVRNFELRLARARAALAAQELDVTHEIRDAYQGIDRQYSVARSAFNRLVAAEERVKAYQAQYELRGTTVDPLLRAQQSRAQAEVAYNQAVAQYNQAITAFYYRTGTILEESNVTIAENTWDDPKAYSDALRRAWARSHAADAPWLKTEPHESAAPPGAPIGAVPFLGAANSVPVWGTPSSSASEPYPASTNPAPAPASPPPVRESEPASPLPSPGAPSRMPQASPGGTATGPSIAAAANRSEIARPAVITAASQGPSRPAAKPRSTQSPPPRPLSPVASAKRVAPLPAAPRPLPPPPQWSMPQGQGVGQPGRPTTSDEFQNPSHDAFNMPLHQISP